MTAYCTKADVKYRLDITNEDTSYDIELDAMIAKADAMIDNALKGYTTVSLTSVPTTILHVSADLAAAFHKENRGKDGSALRQRGEKDLEDYIAATYAASPYTKATAYAVIEEEEE